MIIADTLSMGAVIGAATAVICLAICAALIYVGLRMEYDGAIPFWGGVIAAVATIVVTIFAFWPFKHDYHYWVPKEGRVEKISNRFIKDGDSGVSQRFVVVLNGKPYGIDDTRASLLKVGDQVRLRCKKEHQFMQPYDADGWACRWGTGPSDD